MTSTTPDDAAVGLHPGQAGGEEAKAHYRPGVASNSPDRNGRSADRDEDQDGSRADQSGDRAAMVSRHLVPVRSWPLLVLAAPAAVAVWSGWIGIGQLTGFGQIHPLPGIWRSFHIDTAVTLPIGLEAYAAFALRAWLTSSALVSGRTRRFARFSAITALALGMAGQAAYHLLTQAGLTRAPWEVTTPVSALPVLVLRLGSALAHLLRSDAEAWHAADQTTAVHAPRHAVLPGPGGEASPTRPWPGWGPPTSLPISDPGIIRPGTEQRRVPENPASRLTVESNARPPARARIDDAYAAATTVISAGQRISRRSLRAAGLHGSNADLGMLARKIRSQP